MNTDQGAAPWPQSHAGAAETDYGSDEPYSRRLGPAVGGEIHTSVSGWGGWHVWIDVEAYGSRAAADTALSPTEAFRAAWMLTAAALVCAWKTLRTRKTRRG